MMSSVRDTADMIIELRNEEYPCHKLVISSTSEFFSGALKDNEKMNKYQYNIRGPYQQRLTAPNWMDSHAFSLFIGYVYTGEIGVRHDGRSKE